MELQLTGLTVVSEKWHNQGAQMDLFLNIYEVSPGIKGYFEYDRALFDGETIKGMVLHFEKLVYSWRDHVDQPG
jgi:hypothetical protein